MYTPLSSIVIITCHHFEERQYGSERVWINKPKNGLDKQCKLQVRSRAESQNWGLFFGGKTQVCTNKKMARNKSFQYFQYLGRYNYINSVGRKYSYLLQVTLEIRTFLNMRLKCWKKWKHFKNSLSLKWCFK